MKYQIKYQADGKEYLNESDILDIKYENKDNVLFLTLFPKKKITLISAHVDLFDQLKDDEVFFANGYQTWTDSQEQAVDDWTLKPGFITKIPALEKKYRFSVYGDHYFAPYHKHYSFSYTYLRNKDQLRFYGSLNEKTGFTVFYIDDRELQCYKDIEGLEVDKEYQLFNLISFKGTEEEVFKSYASSFDRTMRVKNKIKGFTTWYRHYLKIDEEKCFTDLNNIKNSGLDFDYFQLDDGYEPAIGDWLVSNDEKFPNGLSYLAKSIKAKGMRAGIWLAPFFASPNSVLFKKHPDWILKDENGEYLVGSGNWGGVYLLDIEKEEVQKYLIGVFSSLKEFGYSLFKLDFLYAACLPKRKDKSRGQMMCEAMEFLRKAVGDDADILGCGVPLFPAFFNCDYCRIGPDISFIFDDHFFMRFCHRERISSKVALMNTIARRQLNGLFFFNDPDVVLLKGTKMTDKQKLSLYDATKKYGGVFFTSDDVSLYTEQDKKLMKDLK